VIACTLYGANLGAVHGARVLHADAAAGERPRGMRFALVWDGGRPISVRMVGRFNVSNLIAVAGALLALGVRFETSLRRFVGAPGAAAGRMQLEWPGVCEPLVVVDYAHSPDALAKVLEALRATVALARGGRAVVRVRLRRRSRPRQAPDDGRDRQRSPTAWWSPATTRAARPVAHHRGDRRRWPGRGRGELDRARRSRAPSARRTADDVVLIAGKGHEAYQEILGTAPAVLGSRAGRRARAADGPGTHRGKTPMLSCTMPSRAVRRPADRRPARAASTRRHRHPRAGARLQLFVALRGERFDGHDFVAARRIQAGAAAALVDAAWAARACGAACRCWWCPTRGIALGDARRGLARRFALPLIGVTGSNGKTTVKEMCAAILLAGESTASARSACWPRAAT
jgi:UDP-N-acetylmuramyl tripeptide synthase